MTSSPASPRMIAQSSVFTVSTNTVEGHCVSIRMGAQAESRPEPNHVRVIIPKELKAKLLRRVMAMNITAATLFPGIDGIGRSMHERAHVRRNDWLIRKTEEVPLNAETQVTDSPVPDSVNFGA